MGRHARQGLPRAFTAARDPLGGPSGVHAVARRPMARRHRPAEIAGAPSVSSAAPAARRRDRSGGGTLTTFVAAVPVRTADPTNSSLGATIHPQDVAHGLYAGNPLAGLIEGFCLALDAGGELEARPVVHVQLRRGVTLSAVKADRLAKACQYGVLRQLAAAGRDFDESVEEDPSTAEIAIALHAYGTGPFADTSTIRNHYLLRGEA
ncbi:hypothetical protein [Streptomyces sp. NPDC053427]|uniref:hypothetical protein n=1 Tax=Streptomyces sp. NPDC053427 TaxID=3365701 RepID=UPI0037D05F18